MINLKNGFDLISFTVVFTFLMLFTVMLYGQDFSFSDDFSDGDLSDWTFYKFSTGLHGPVTNPAIVDSSAEISTRDQQATLFINGDSSWANYTLEADMRIEQALDDASLGLITFFYLNNPHYVVNGQDTVAYESKHYALTVRGRESTWRLSGPGGNFADGFQSVAVGVDYHVKIVINGNRIQAYFYELGTPEVLLADVTVPDSVSLSGGLIGFGGTDDKILIDNVTVNHIVTGIKKISELPENFTLQQNYPNPFNPSTTILYTIPNQDFVTLNVYDILGEKVKTLVSEFQTAGNHTFHFQPRELASGVYFYELKVGETFLKRKEMLLLK